MPTDLCAPIQTPAEKNFFWQLNLDVSCKNSDGSDNFLAMAAKFNQHWGVQVRLIPEHQSLDSSLTSAKDAKVVLQSTVHA